MSLWNKVGVNYTDTLKLWSVEHGGIEIFTAHSEPFSSYTTYYRCCCYCCYCRSTTALKSFGWIVKSNQFVLNIWSTFVFVNFKIFFFKKKIESTTILSTVIGTMGHKNYTLFRISCTALAHDGTQWLLLILWLRLVDIYSTWCNAPFVSACSCPCQSVWMSVTHTEDVWPSQYKGSVCGTPPPFHLLRPALPGSRWRRSQSSQGIMRHSSLPFFPSLLVSDLPTALIWMKWQQRQRLFPSHVEL